MKTSEFRNEQIQIDEGPCDIALPADIKKMSADVFSKYARWKKECEENESKHSTADDEAKLARMFDEEDEFEEGYMITGDWQNLDIDHDDLEVDDAFPGDTVWSVGRGGAPSKYFYFTSQNTGTHFATAIDIGDGSWKIEDESGKTITAGLGKWDEVEAAVRKVYDMQNVEEGHRTLPGMDTERYTERKGLEGPMRARNGKVVYYDPKEGQYYDPDTDIYISNDEWDAMNESSPGWDGPEYKKGDLIVAQNGQSYILDEYDDGVWFAVGDDGEEHEFVPGTELHHEPMSESEDDSVVSALDTMRNHLNDYSHDPSDRWEKYNQYRNERRQISQRAKDVTEWGNSHLDQQIAKQKAEDDAEKSDKKWKKNFDSESAKRRRDSARRQQQQADQA